MAEIKSRAQITFDFEMARTQAARLEAAAADIRREAGLLTGYKAEVAGAWESDNSVRFTGKMGRTAEELIRIAARLERTAGTIQKNARIIYNAEMEAKRLADIRSHS